MWAADPSSKPAFVPYESLMSAGWEEHGVLAGTTGGPADADRGVNAALDAKDAVSVCSNSLNPLPFALIALSFAHVQSCFWAQGASALARLDREMRKKQQSKL